MSKILASFQPYDFSPAITNSQAMGKVVSAVRSLNLVESVTNAPNPRKITK